MKFTKRILWMMLSLCASILGIGLIPVPVAAQKIVRHEENTAAKIPLDLQGVRIAIAFNGGAADQARALFMEKLGVLSNDFVRGSKPCFAPQTLVCVSMEQPSQGVPISGSGYSSYYGGNSNTSVASTGSGELYSITLHMDLYEVDEDGNRHVTPLAVVTALGFAGTSSDSYYGSNQHGGSSSNFTAETPKEVAVGTAIHNAVMVLLDNHWYSHFRNPKAHAQFFPGGGDAVRKAFAQDR